MADISTAERIWVIKMANKYDQSTSGTLAVLRYWAGSFVFLLTDPYFHYYVFLAA